MRPVTPLRQRSRRITAVAAFLIAFGLLVAGLLAARQPSGRDVAVAAKPFSIELEPQEIITTDLRRVILRDCDKITFEVRDPGLFVSSDAALVAKMSRNAVTSARRAILGNKSSAEIRDRADTLRDEIRRTVDDEAKYSGVAVAEMAGDLRICAVPVRPPE